MAWGIGDQIPDVTLYLATDEGPKGVSSKELMGSGTKVVFAVPGAFTPICAEQHVPDFLNNLDALKAKGVDEVICLAVNDAFVMGSWAKPAVLPVKSTWSVTAMRNSPKPSVRISIWPHSA